VRTVLLFVAAVAVAGCATAPVPEAPAVPSSAAAAPQRPREVRLDGVDPCSLMTPAERTEFGLDGAPGYTNTPTPLFGGSVPTCTITGLADRPVALGIGAVTTVGIERWQQDDLADIVRTTSVMGFPSVVAIP